MASTRKHSSERYISNPVPDYATFCVQLRSSASKESGGSGEVSRIIYPQIRTSSSLSSYPRREVYNVPVGQFRTGCK